MTDMMWQDAEEAEPDSGGRIGGVAVGEVTDNQDPQKMGRVRVRLPWQADGDTSFWARCATPMAGRERGVYFLPEVGDEVLVAAENDDPSFLYVLGALWNGDSGPPATNEDGGNNTRLVKSRSGHTIRINDDDGSPEIEVKLADGSHILLDQNGITVEDKQQNTIKLDASSGAVEVTAGQQLTLKGGTVSIEASSSMTVKSSGTLTLQGSVVQIN